MNVNYRYHCILAPNLSNKEIKRIYEKRRKWLKDEHCPRCGVNLTPVIFDHEWFPERKGEVLAKGGITKDQKCPSCETDLVEFCFQDLMDEALARAARSIGTPAKNTQKLNNKSSATKGSKKKAKKKCSNKKSGKVKNKGQKTLW